MSENRQLFINMFAQSLGFIINVGISFFLTPFIIKHVGVAAYGFVGLANDFVGYAQLVTIALNSMAARFITIELHKNNMHSAKQYFTSVMVANMFFCILLIFPAILILIFLNKLIEIPLVILSDVRLLWIFIFANFILSIITSIYTVAAFAKNRLDVPSLIGIKSNCMRAILLIFAYSYFYPNIWYIGFAALCSTAFIAVENRKYTNILLPEMKVDRKCFSFNSIKTLIGSGIWNTFNKLGSILSNGLDLLIANMFIGSEAMGILAIAKILPNVILSMFGMLAGVFSPQLVISYAKGDIREMKNQLNFSMKILGAVASIPIVILFVYGDIFYTLWVPTQNAELLHILSIVSCFAFVFALPQEGMWNIFTATNKIKGASIYLFGNSLLTIIIVFVLIGYLDTDIEKLLLIAGTSTVFSIIRGLTFLPMYGAKCLNLNLFVFYPKIFKNVVSVIILIILSIMIKHNFCVNTWITLIFMLASTFLLAIFLNFFIILNYSERKKIEKMIREISRII